MQLAATVLDKFIYYCLFKTSGNIILPDFYFLLVAIKPQAKNSIYQGEHKTRSTFYANV